MSDKTQKTAGVDNDWRNLLYTELKRTGGDPSVLFEILESIVEQRAWETLLDDSGNPVGSLRRLIEAPLPIGCGQNPDKVLRLLDVEHRYEKHNTKWHDRMSALRDVVRAELSKDITVRDKPGKPAEEQSNFDISKLNINEATGGGTSKEYRIAVLNRDAPDLAEEVIDGSITAAEGIRRLRERQGKPMRRQSAVNLLSAESSANTLIKYMPKEVLHRLIDLLNEWRDTNP